MKLNTRGGTVGGDGDGMGMGMGVMSSKISKWVAQSLSFGRGRSGRSGREGDSASNYKRNFSNNLISDKNNNKNISHTHTHRERE